MFSRETSVVRQINGRLDVVLASVLATLATSSHLLRGEVWPAILDLLACLAAALTTRWPRAAGVGLGLVLVALMMTPPGWASLGEYSALIPILCTGMRGQRQLRARMTVGYGLILAALTWEDLPGDPWVVVALGVWAALIAVLWVIGNLFTAYREAQDKLRASALQQQRLALARDLHDTVARDLTRASLQAQAVLASHRSPELEAVLTGIQQASTQLRWMLALLRDAPRSSSSDTLGGTPAQALQEAIKSLQRHGITVTATIDGDLDSVPAALVPTLRSVIGEACANIERHADRTKSCAVIVSVGDDAIDAVFMNEVPRGQPHSETTGVGLAGVKERLVLVGGDLSTEQEGSQWISRVTIPV